jgi:NitT/TauT family transport system permease protein/taurine transport system permease protein
MKGQRRSWMAGAIFAVLFLVTWEIVFRLELVSPIIFGSFLLAFRITILEIGAAVAVAWTLGILLGVISGASPILSRLCAPVLSAFMAIPLVILYPVLIAWLGLGPVSKIVFGALSGVFPIALNTLAGVRSVDRGYRMMALAMGANRFQIMFRVMAPLALPAIVSGLRLGTSLIVIGVVLSEMLGSADGIGFWISYHRSLFNTGQVYLGILLALMIASVVNAGLSAVERFYSRSHVDRTASTADG